MMGIEELGDSPDQITLLGGADRSEFEILDFQAEVDRLGPMGGSSYRASRSSRPIWPDVGVG